MIYLIINQARVDFYRYYSRSCNLRMKKYKINKYVRNCTWFAMSKVVLMCTNRPKRIFDRSNFKWYCVRCSMCTFLNMLFPVTGIYLL